ncbi:MAG: DoxX family protein, partial [Muribaculaceae bacterium]|nr:DoxX family protein [Muribaculaceae bacterium]
MSQDNESSPQSEIAETGAISTEDKNVAAKNGNEPESPVNIIGATSASTKENTEEGQPEKLQPPLAAKIVTILLRIVVGGVFIASGFTKAIDPWGFIYKIEDYLNVWGIGVPRSIIFVGAVGLSAYEFLFGAMLVLGAYRRTSVRALMLTMLFMLPLTAYIAIANPVADCGCFGEWLLLSNWATFGKNIVITAMLVWLWRYNFRIKWAFVRPSLQWVAATACAIYLIIIAGYGYMVQPLIDFRPYPVGKSPW